MLLLASSVHFCRICGRMCQSQDSRIDDQGLPVHTACHATRVVSIAADGGRQPSAVTRRQPVREYLHGFAVRDA
jgi:hypothetical protein